MRLPWGTIDRIAIPFLTAEYLLISAVSFEDRCCHVPLLLGPDAKAIALLQINDPDDAFPNYSDEIQDRTKKNKNKLEARNIKSEPQICKLLDPEERMLQILEKYQSVAATVVLDITSLPKRFFCFILKRLLLMDEFRNVIVTYTQGGPSGYSQDHLAEDAMSPDYLPGYAPPLLTKSNTVVVGVGFESLGLRALLDQYSEGNIPKMLLAFSSDFDAMSRQWDTIRQVLADDGKERDRPKKFDLEVVAAWDAERVYRVLKYWYEEESRGLLLAPFGPKPHSLGMALFALHNECGMSYTQPKSYNPNYTKGSGTCWGYVVKWEGISCYDRRSKAV